MGVKGVVFVMWLSMFCSLVVGSMHGSGRKLLMMKVQENYKEVSSLEERLYLTALPKGNVPASTPSKKGHRAPTIEQKLIARHLAAVDRILRSVPSPGVGH